MRVLITTVLEMSTALLRNLVLQRAAQEPLAARSLSWASRQKALFMLLNALKVVEKLELPFRVHYARLGLQQCLTSQQEFWDK